LKVQTVARISELRELFITWRHSGERVAFVPTMGNLHPGHGSLVGRAAELADRVIVSIFVNPLQFGPNEDFAAYPRTPDEDRHVLESLNVDLLFSPEVADIYPRGQESTARVHVPVVEVVAKLLNIVQPDVAVFGEKDYQQLLIIRRAALDLCMPVEIIGAPTTREPDGLAMSSRNRYLSVAERAVAPAIYAELERARKAIEPGSNGLAALANRGAEALRQAGFRPDYFEIRDAATLEEPGAQSQELVVLTAARIGRARLIDNVRARRAAPRPT
jgi:pantoate--beta-alanine ligase